MLEHVTVAPPHGSPLRLPAQTRVPRDLPQPPEITHPPHHHPLAMQFFFFLLSTYFLALCHVFVLCLLCQQGINSILFTAESPALGDYFLVNRINEGMPWHGWAVGEKTISQPHGVAQVLEKPHPRMALSHLELI